MLTAKDVYKRQADQHRADGKIDTSGDDDKGDAYGHKSDIIGSVKYADQRVAGTKRRAHCKEEQIDHHQSGNRYQLLQT